MLTIFDSGKYLAVPPKPTTTERKKRGTRKGRQLGNSWTANGEGGWQLTAVASIATLSHFHSEKWVRSQSLHYPDGFSFDTKVSKFKIQHIVGSCNLSSAVYGDPGQFSRCYEQEIPKALSSEKGEKPYKGL